MSFLNLLKEMTERRRRYVENLQYYLQVVKETARRRDPNARVLLFGSYAEGRQRPDSDVDVLIITSLAADERARLSLRSEINDTLGRPNPFELHIMTPEQYAGWYSKFIGRSIEV